jgi:hypothetical protein
LVFPTFRSFLPFVFPGVLFFSFISYFRSLSFLHSTHLSSVGIATRSRAGRPSNRSSFPAGARYFSFLHGDHSGSWANAFPSSFPGVKRPGCEADHTSVSSAEVKNVSIYTSI